MSKFVKGVFLGLSLIIFTALPAFAHVTVNPDEAAVGYSVATVRVPNERDVPTVSVRVVVPEGVTVHGVKPVPGWSYAVTRAEPAAEPKKPAEIEEAQGHEATEGRITEITWSGGQIGASEFMEFPLSVQYISTGDVSWNAYQMYADGEVVAWDSASEEHPASIVSVISEPKIDTLTNDVMTIGDNQRRDPSQWLSVGAMLLAGTALFFALQKKK